MGSSQHANGVLCVKWSQVRMSMGVKCTWYGVIRFFELSTRCGLVSTCHVYGEKAWQRTHRERPWLMACQLLPSLAFEPAPPTNPAARVAQLPAQAGQSPPTTSALSPAWLVVRLILSAETRLAFECSCKSRHAPAVASEQDERVEAR